MNFAKTILQKTPLYHPLRDRYLRLFKHDYWEKNINWMRAAYGPFVKAGSLVFDVGANVGDHTRCFVGLGATVICVEPLPQCAEQIRTIYPKNKITIVACAVGAEKGFAEMRVNEESYLSSLSEEWVSVARQSERFKNSRWGEAMKVPVVTLDSLIAQYGKPDFIKIDVEGFESFALDGLSYMPKGLSFEFNSELLTETLKCLRKPVFPRSARFNYRFEDESKFKLATWVTASEMAAIVQNEISKSGTFGDIVALARDVDTP